jgi:aspartyl-tRNA(Asn)/glutamyl-tRNA(Gln) amidotransferase subunit A
VTGGSLAALAEAIRGRTVSPGEAVEAALARVARLDPRLRAFITVDAPGARAAAAAREADLAAGRPVGPLHGVPLAHKDLFGVPGLPASCGTRAPDYGAGLGESTAVRRLEAAGAVTLGTLNMAELALGPFGENAHHGDAQTPWRPGHCAGGSSSGSAAAVAAGLVAGALGTDTGGSIRLPAACCGVAGLKPTYGRVSRAGVMPLAWSLDHVGPLARTVRDVAILLGVAAAPDPRDPTSSRRPVPDYAAALDAPVAGLRVGRLGGVFADDLHPAVAAAVEAALAVLRGLGAEVREVAMPEAAALAEVCHVLARAESAAVHARVVRETPEALDPAVRVRLEAGFRVSAYEYLQAARLRGHLTRQVLAGALAAADVLVAPTIPEPPPPLVGLREGSPDARVARMARFSRLTRPFNGLGVPVLSVPCGFTADGLPLGLQIAGRPFEEATVLRVGHAYEQAAGWWRARPPGLE